MPTPKVLDNIDALLAPISPDQPAGAELSYDIKGQLDQLRKEIKNPDRPEDDKDPDWPGIIKLTTETLTKTSKHCRPAARLTEALVRGGQGYAGLRDGLHLIQRLVGECWDRLQPVIPAEEGEDRTDALEIRLTDFRWLDEVDDTKPGEWFPNTVRMVPIFGRTDRFSILQMKGAREKKGPVPWPEFEKLIRDTGAPTIQNAVDDTGDSLRELDQLVVNLRTKLAAYKEVQPPAMTRLRDAVQECHTLLQQIQREFFPKAGAPVVNGEVATGETPAAEAPPANRLVTRDDALRQMQEAADLMRHLEPHSPIPYLVERAITLGKLPFPQLMKELIQEQKALADLYRLVGIKEDKKT
jgi:type VI secretion system protein ImpA